VHWLLGLGQLFSQFDDTARGEKKAIEYFSRVGELGLGVGFKRVAEIYIKNRNWDEARRYFHKAADKFHADSICILGIEAALGFFLNDGAGENSTLEADQSREPDLAEAFRLFHAFVLFIGH
jgi:TPR repeat protein